ncbi:ATP-binding cassette domain-containing protein [Pseudomonas sp. NPDC007930]|uniref:ABC transporter ATP-binding protein n=1 Tax=Pseudomonas sp. NPDC007930 TaxID=3364417 RepID=UPI0036E4E054
MSEAIQPLLEVDNLSRRFGPQLAVDGVSLAVQPGEILGVIGPNGSGKSTLFNCMLGQLAPSAGEVRLSGRKITTMGAADRCHQGMARTFQLLQTFPGLTVAQNLRVAAQEHQGSMLSRLLRGGWGGTERAVQRSLAFFKLEHLAHERAEALSYGQQKLLDIAMALIVEPRILFLDEPAGGVTPQMIAQLKALLLAANRERGVSLVLVEHNMDFVMSICTRIVVLAAGRILAQGTPQQILHNPTVIEAYLGG